MVPSLIRAADPIPIRVGMGDDHEPSIAANPSGPDAMMAWFTDSGIYWASTRNGWTTSRVEFLDGALNGVDPSVAYDPATAAGQPRFWLCFLGSPFARNDLQIARSEIDLGGPLEDLRFDGFCAIPNGNGADKPWLVAGPRPADQTQTNLYVVYVYDSSNTRSVKWLRFLGDASGTNLCDPANWTAPESLGIYGSGPLPMVSPTDPNRLLLVWWAIAPYDDPQGCRAQHIRIRYTANTGDANPLWSEILDVATLQTECDPCACLNALVPAHPANIGKFPSAVVSPSQSGPLKERIHIVWTERNMDQSCTGGNVDLDIYYAQVAFDIGPYRFAVVDGPKIISPDPAGYVCADQYQPWITETPDGVLHVIYYSNENTPDQGTNRSDASATALYADLYHTCSADQGATWSSPTRLTPDSSFLDGTGYQVKEYMGITPGGDGANIYGAFWQSGKGQDMYTIVLAPSCGGR